MDELRLKLLQSYEELKTLLDDLQDDVIKVTKGNRSASVRVRRALRDVNKLCKVIKNNSLTLVKKNKES